MGNYKKEMIAELAAKIQKAGFRVFLAAKGTYGFYTDKEGTRVISFQVDLCHISFSGNYITDRPRQTGTGWRITDDIVNDFKEVFNASPPNWATCGATWRFTTIEDHFNRYLKSSKYKESL